MATIQDLGKVAYLNRGAYNSSTKYEVNDVVTYQGSSYVSNVNNNQGNLPTNATYWQVLVQKPVKGVDYFTTADKKEMVDEITEDAESEFNQNVQAKTEAFNTNASDKTSAFNQNATSKTTDFDSNATSKTTTFNNNATSKTTDYNTNASSKISEYNTNHDNKVSAYDTNASDKTTTFDNHVSDKTDEFDSHVEDKIEEFDENTKKLYTINYGINLYDFENRKQGYKDNGTVAQDSNFDLTNKIKVPNGKMAVLSFSYSEGGTRVCNVNGARFLTIYNEDGTLYQAITDNERYYFNNNTEETKYIYFTLYSQSNSNYRYDVQVELINSKDTAPTLNDLTGVYEEYKEIIAINNNVKIPKLNDLEDNQLYDDANGSEIYITDAHSTNVNEFGMSKESSQETTSIAGGDEYDSPTPEHPQEVKTVKGYSNLFDKTMATLNKGVSVDTGREYNNNDSFVTDYIDISEFDYINLNGKSSSNNTLWGAFYDENKVYTKGFSINDPNEKSIDVSGEKIIRISVLKEYLENLIITEGTEEHPYVPYGNNYVDVKVVGKNLFDKNNANILRGYFSTTGNIMSYSSDYRRILYIPCKENTTYTITKVLSKMFRIASTATVPANNVAIINRNIVDTSTFRTFNTGTGANYLVVNYYNANEDTLTEQEILDSIQIEQGSTSTTYEPYKETIVPIPLNGNEMAGIGDYKDELIVDKNGKVYLNKLTGKKIFNGNEEWNLSTAGGLNNYYSDNLLNNGLFNDTLNYLSNYFRPILNADRYIDGTFFININQRIVFTNSKIATVTEWQQWLSSHNTSVYYVLATSDPIDLNTTIDLRLFKGVNNITNSEDADMKIRYVQNSQIVINKIKNALLEIGGGE